MRPETLTIGLATRGRPDLLSDTVARTVANLSNQDTTFLVLADADDETMRGWKDPTGRATLHVAERPDTIAEKWNRMVTVAPADVYMAMVDHSPVVTPGFDIKVLESASVFPDGIGGVYGHMFCLSFPNFNACTHRMMEIMGGFYPTHFPYWFVDHWFDDVCRMIGRFVLCDIHFDGSRKPGTQEHREPGLWATLYDALHAEREACAERLFAAMDEPEWRKDMLRQSFPLLHERSRIINSYVRSMPANEQTMDSRYLRMRARAAAKLQSIYHTLQEAA